MKGRGIKGVGKEIKRDGGIKRGSRGDAVLILSFVTSIGFSLIGSANVVIKGDKSGAGRVQNR